MRVSPIFFFFCSFDIKSSSTYLLHLAQKKNPPYLLAKRKKGSIGTNISSGADRRRRRAYTWRIPYLK